MFKIIFVDISQTKTNYCICLGEWVLFIRRVFLTFKPASEIFCIVYRNC